MKDAIDLRQFRYFVAVAEELHIGRAAQRLHISQPPLSRQIHQLEQQLGLALFVRHSGGVTLTGAGAAFLPEVRRALAQAARAIAVATQADGGEFVLGYTTVFDRSAIPDVLGHLRQRFPATRISAKGQHSIKLVRAIGKGQMDAAFIGLHTHAPGLQVETLHEERLVLALPAMHGLARRRAIGFSDLNEEPMFWFERRANPGYYDYCAAFFEKIGFTPRVVPEPPDHHILLALIAEGQGVALIPASLRKVGYQGVVFRELKKQDQGLKMGIALAWLASNRSPVLRALQELVMHNH